VNLDLKTVMKPHIRVAIRVFAWATVMLFPPSFLSGQTFSDAWSRKEAAEKIGMRVEYIAAPGHNLLQWGPRFAGWSPEKQPKSTGRAVEKGERGTIKGFIKAPQEGYFLIIHWDPVEGKQTFWTTIFTRSDYKSVIELKP